MICNLEGSCQTNNTVTMTMIMKITLLDIIHINTMIGKNIAEKNNVVNELQTIQII